MSTARAFTGLVVAGVLVLIAGSFRAAEAQELQPIYPAYDGFIKNPDGTYTIAFAYFSHNSSVVTVEAGADNSFSPGPTDRMQPTSFKPGHWRFQCVMVVPSDFDGKLSWNLAYAGTKTGTSQSMLQSNWFLVEGAEELSKIDYAKAAKGVCLNRPPVVRVLGAIRREKEEVLGVIGTTGTQESLFGSVNDEGLPRGSSLNASWKQISGPGTVKFDDAHKARTHVVYPAAGAYVLELTGTDGEFTVTRRVTVNVK